MKNRRTLNPKRQLKPSPSNQQDAQILQKLAKKIGYKGNAAHKRNPGDFGLEPPLGPRPNKTLCDDANIFRVRVALRLLKKGVLKGFISQNERNGWPQNIWAVTKNGILLEAQLGNQETGDYHGYPMPINDPFRDVILARWKSSD